MAAQRVRPKGEAFWGREQMRLDLVLARRRLAARRRRLEHLDHGRGVLLELLEGVLRLLELGLQLLEELTTYMEMDAAERATKLDTMKGALKKAEDDHNELLKQLQAQFKESQDALEKLKEDSAPVIKMLKAATPSGKAAAGKDEV